MYVLFENKADEFRAGISSKLDFGAHMHDHIEIVYMLEGSTKAMADFREETVMAGDVFISFPNQIHQYQGMGSEKSVILIFPSNVCPEYRQILFTKVPVSPVIRQPGRDILKLFMNICTYNKSDDVYSRGLRKGNLLILLGMLFKKMDFEPVKAAENNSLKNMLTYCMENYNKEIHLSDMAEALHLSKTYISHVFGKKLNVSFNDYINTLRISGACRLLLSDDYNITDVSYLAGFGTTRSFNRAFIKQIGMTPREYKKSRQ